MSEENSKRTSLRGRGRQILLGQNEESTVRASGTEAEKSDTLDEGLGNFQLDSQEEALVLELLLPPLGLSPASDVPPVPPPYIVPALEEEPDAADIALAQMLVSEDVTAEDVAEIPVEIASEAATFPVEIGIEEDEEPDWMLSPDEIDELQPGDDEFTLLPSSMEDEELEEIVPFEEFQERETQPEIDLRSLAEEDEFLVEEIDADEAGDVPDEAFDAFLQTDEADVIEFEPEDVELEIAIDEEHGTLSVKGELTEDKAGDTLGAETAPLGLELLRDIAAEHDDMLSAITETDEDISPVSPTEVGEELEEPLNAELLSGVQAADERGVRVAVDELEKIEPPEDLDEVAEAVIVPPEVEFEAQLSPPEFDEEPERNEDRSREAVPTIEEDISAHQIDLSNLNRLVQGESATLIPTRAEVARRPVIDVEEEAGEVEVEPEPDFEFEEPDFDTDFAEEEPEPLLDFDTLPPEAEEMEAEEALPPVEESVYTPPVDLSLGGTQLEPGLEEIVPPAPEEAEAIAEPPLEEIAEVAEPSPLPTGEVYPITPPLSQHEAEEVASRLLHETAERDDRELLRQLVDDMRMRELWDMIEALQEDLVEYAAIDRQTTDEYQQELLQASGLLLKGRQNYDESRAIVYRIRADLKRERQIQADIERYRWWLYWYIIVWGIAVVTLGLLADPVNTIAEDIGLPFLGDVYLPMLAGALGGLLIAYRTLNKHISIRRDFDPAYIPWYLFTPVVGGLMGFLTYLLIIAGVAVATAESVSSVTDTLEEPQIIIWLLTFIAGMNQNFVLNRLRGFGGSQAEDH